MLLWVGDQGVPIGCGISQINFKDGDKARHEVLRPARREALQEAKSISAEETFDLGEFWLLSCVPTSQLELRFKNPNRSPVVKLRGPTGTQITHFKASLSLNVVMQKGLNALEFLCAVKYKLHTICIYQNPEFLTVPNSVEWIYNIGT